MANKYLFGDIFDKKSFTSGFKKLEAELIKVDRLVKDIGKGKSGKQLQSVNKIMNGLVKTENKLTEAQKNRLKFQKIATRANEKKRREAIKLSNALNLELQVEKELQKIRVRQISTQAKSIAAKKAGTKATKGLTASIKSGVSSLKAYATSMLGVTAAIMAIRKIAGTFKEYIGLAEAQILAEKKLSVVLKERTGATRSQIDAIIALTKEQQRMGVVGDEVQLAGAQQFATFVKSTKSVKTLIPALNNLLVQQKGLNATQNDAINIANLAGRAFQGQLGSLTRVGISFDETQGKILKFGTEEERAAALADIITGNVGAMNEALAKTDLGKIQQVNNQIGDLKEEIGKGLIPVVRQFKELTLKGLIEAKPVIDDILVITKAIATLKGSTKEAEEGFGNVTKTLKRMTGTLSAIWQWNKLLIKGFKGILRLFGVIESEQSKRAGKVRERVDDITKAFKSLSKVQRNYAEKELKKLNEKMTGAERFTSAYATALNNILINAQNLADPDGLPRTTIAVTDLTNALINAAKEAKSANDRLSELNKTAQETPGGGETVDPELGKPTSILVDNAFKALFAATTAQAPTAKEKLQGYFKQLFDKDSKKSFLARVFGGGEDSEAIAAVVTDSFNRLFESISEGVDRELESIQTLIDRQTDAINSTQDLLTAEEDRLLQLQLAGAAFDTSEKNRLQEKLQREQEARNKSLKAEKEAKKKQQRLDITQAIINTASATLKAFESAKNPILGAILAAIAAAFGATQIAAISNQKYATGTNYLELGGNPNGIDTIPILANKGERIVPTKDNSGIPRTFPNSLLPTAVSYFLDSKSGTGILNARSEGLLSQIATNTKKDGIVYRNGEIYKINTKHSTITRG